MQIVEALAVLNDCYAANLARGSKRYRNFQDNGPQALMLHSVGCARADGKVQAGKWNQANYKACAHAAIDSNTGIVYQTLPWNFLGWHCGSGANGTANDTHIGVEMCESNYIRYYLPGEAGYQPGKFSILDKDKAQAHAKTTYNAAVELFAMLCVQYAIDPVSGIISHNEGGKAGIASGHIDPEHFWTQLGMSYTMDSFRKAVKAKLDTGDTLYRIQVGAFRNKDYAEAYLAKVQKDYPNAFIVEVKK